ncbi:hypothetical protein H4R34_004314 [Dimargaris verticillata]|uniref:Uncharacterized protein n=1 Tax=Dimargaris verticillata TaxID=2761393 RepID=A0A9W8AZ65_9FUNG|nr:hypothetical protein H4R34_004314 [Dimargaris verticillata]
MFGTTFNALVVMALVNLSLVVTAPPPNIAVTAQSAPLPGSDVASVINAGYSAPTTLSDAGRTKGRINQVIDDEALAFINDHPAILKFLVNHKKYLKYAPFVNDPIPMKYCRYPGYSHDDYLTFKNVVLQAIFKAEAEAEEQARQHVQSENSSDASSDCYFDC